jgi:arginine decarboxylase
VQYDPEHMVESVRRQAERAVSERRLTNEQMRTFMHHYEDSLRSYTYLTSD